MMRLLRTLLVFAAGRAAGRAVGRRGRTGRGQVVLHTPPPSKWKRRARTIAGFLLAVGAAGVLVLVSGVVSIKASSGHWAVTRWMFTFGMERSVNTHAIGIRVPPLDSLDRPALVAKGAGHYETGCRGCHGSPLLRNPRVAAAMTPEPPYLPAVLPQWDAADLFYIVKHGIKFAGMPAWPALERDDEVWAVVAFLRAFPALDEAGYRALAAGDAATAGLEVPLSGLAGPGGPGGSIELIVRASCARCHGAEGLGRGLGAFPKLAGQSPAYLYAALRAYAGGRRASGIMEPVAAGLLPDQMRALAHYYAELPEGPTRADAALGVAAGEGDVPAAVPVDAEAIARGARIAREGVPSEGIPSCEDCHGPGDAPRNPYYPRLAGQYADYLYLQLTLFHAGLRGGSAYAHLMHPTADRLTVEQMQDVAAYYASLGAAPAAGTVRPSP